MRSQRLALFRGLGGMGAPPMGLETRASRPGQASQPQLDVPCRFACALLSLALFFTLSSSSSLYAAAVAPRMLLLDGARAGTAIVAVGERGTILRSTDQAGTWQRAAVPTQATLTGVAFAHDGQRGWAVGHDALILATTDGGVTWAKQYQGESLQDSFLDVLALDTGHAIAIGAYGLFAVTRDEGKTWTRQKIGDDDYHLNRISRGPTGTLYLAGEHGTLLRSTDNGTSWSKIPTSYEGSFYGILALDRRTLLAYGLRGRVYRSTNDGADWTLVTTPPPVLLATALQLQGNALVFAGQARTLLVSRDYGQTLTSLDSPLLTGVAELLEISEGRILALGEAGATVLPKP